MKNGPDNEQGGDKVESKVARFRKAVLEDLEKFQEKSAEENPVDSLLARLESRKDDMTSDEYQQARELIVDINQIQSRNARHIEKVWQLLMGDENEK